MLASEHHEKPIAAGSGDPGVGVLELGHGRGGSGPGQFQPRERVDAQKGARLAVELLVVELYIPGRIDDGGGPLAGSATV